MISKSENRNANEIVTNLNLKTKDNLTQVYFQKHMKLFTFITVASSSSDTKKQNEDNIKRVQDYQVNAEITLNAADSGKPYSGQERVLRKRGEWSQK